MSTPVMDAVLYLKRAMLSRGLEPGFVTLGIGAYDAASSELDRMTYRGASGIGIGKLETLHGLEVLKGVRHPAMTVIITRDRPRDG